MNKRMKRKSGYYCKGNVMTPLNWFSGAFEAVLIPIAAHNYSNWFGAACFVLAILFVIVYIIIYLYIFHKDPDRLQSEEYNLQYQEMTLSGGALVLSDDQKVIEAEANQEPASESDD